MPTCKQITEMAAERSEGNLGAPEREAFDRHLSGCAGCRAFVGQLELARQAASHLPEPPVPPALNDALLAAFDRAATSRAPARTRPWAVLVALVAMAGMLAMARHRSAGTGDWVVAGALAAVALVLAALGGRFRAALGAAGVGAAIAAVAATGRTDVLEAGTGMHCFALEASAAALVAGAAWLGVRGAGRAMARRALAGGAIAGALAADAALQITCGTSDGTPHLLAFHVGGVLLAAAAGAVLLRRGGSAADSPLPGQVG